MRTMFTGIVEEVGLVRAIQRRTGFQRTTVEARRVLEDVSIGDSISIDGACHTVVEAERRSFSFESVSETLERTTLGRLKTGDRVNLERSMKLSDRLGGHLVAGHVDGMGRVLERRRWADNMVFRIGMQAELAAYLADKGSIAVDADQSDDCVRRCAGFYSDGHSAYDGSHDDRRTPGRRRGQSGGRPGGAVPGKAFRPHGERKSGDVSEPGDWKRKRRGFVRIVEPRPVHL